MVSHDRSKKTKKEVNDRLKRFLERYELHDPDLSLRFDVVAETRIGEQEYVLIRRRPVAYVDALSKQEYKTAVLAAMGLETKEIARRLSLSPYTVASHLRKVFKKLKVGSRAALGFQMFARSDMAGVGTLVTSKENEKS